MRISSHDHYFCHNLIISFHSIINRFRQYRRKWIPIRNSESMKKRYIFLFISCRVPVSILVASSTDRVIVRQHMCAYVYLGRLVKRQRASVNGWTTASARSPSVFARGLSQNIRSVHAAATDWRHVPATDTHMSS